jgi:hypothetical protein
VHWPEMKTFHEGVLLAGILTAHPTTGDRLLASGHTYDFCGK